MWIVIGYWNLLLRLCKESENESNRRSHLSELN